MTIETLNDLKKCKTRIDIFGYEEIRIGNRWHKTHNVVDEFINGEPIKGIQVHHMDFNKLNNSPDNLIRLPKDKHISLHKSTQQFGKENPFYNHSHTDETRTTNSEKHQGKNNPMYGKHGKNNPNYGRKVSKEETQRRIDSLRMNKIKK